MERENVLKVGIGSNERNALMDTVANGDGGVRDSNWRDGFDTVDFLNRFNVVESEIGFDVLIIESELVDNIIGDGLGSSRTDKNEVGIFFIAIGANETINAASEGKN